MIDRWRANRGKPAEQEVPETVPESPAPTEEGGGPAPDALDLCQELLESFEQGHTDAWCRLNAVLARDPDSGHLSYQAREAINLSDYRNWDRVGADLRERLTAAAVKYLEVCVPVPHQRGDLRNSSGVRALELLRQGFRAGFDGLPTSVWRTWGQVLVSCPDPFEASLKREPAELLAIAYAKVPEVVESALEDLLASDEARRTTLAIGDRVRLCTSTRLARLFVRAGLRDGLLENNRLELFRAALAVGYDTAVEELQGLATRSPDWKVRDPSTRGIVAAAAALVRWSTPVAWPRAWQLLHDSPVVGRQAVQLLVRNRTDALATSLLESLPESAIADLYLWVREHFPDATEHFPKGGGSMTLQHYLAQFRNDLLGGLRNKNTAGAVRALRTIAQATPDNDWLRDLAIEARVRFVETDWSGRAPRELLAMASSRQARHIESASVLLDVVVELLDVYQRRLREHGGLVDSLWYDDMTPRTEKRLTDALAYFLRSELVHRPVVLNREVEVRSSQRTDIKIEALAESARPDETRCVSVIVEVKGQWHSELLTAMETQLKQRYLRDQGHAAGLYAVFWFDCARWPKADRERRRVSDQLDLASARSRLEKQAGQLSTTESRIVARVLNAGLPN